MTGGVGGMGGRGGTCDHVLDIISMPRTIDMSIMTFTRLILNMSRRNRNPPRLLLRSSINLIISLKFRSPLLRKIFRNSLHTSTPDEPTHLTAVRVVFP